MTIEARDLPLEIGLQKVVFEQDAVLGGMMPTLDPALSVGMTMSITSLFHDACSAMVSQLSSFRLRLFKSRKASVNGPSALGHWI